MIVRLILMRKRKRIWTAQVRQKEATLGRAVGCTVRIPSSQVSRLHCRLRIEDGVVTVEDLESVNGTFINGKRVREAEILHPGDHLSVGAVTFLVEYELSSTTLRPLELDDDSNPQETASDVDLLELVEPGPAADPPLVTEDPVEIIEGSAPPAKKKNKKPSPPKEQPLEVIEDTDVETVPLAEQDEIHLSDSGNLREFLVELDNADENPNE